MRLLAPLRLLLVIAIVAVLGVASASVVSNTSRKGVAAHLNSTLDMSVPGDEFGPDADAGGVASRPEAAQYTDEGTVFGPVTGTHTLVLYDTNGPIPAHSELSALNAALLATHFGQVTSLPVSQYRAGMMERFDAVLYVGSAEDEPLAPDFITEVGTTAKPIIWAGANVTALGGPDGTATAAFVQKYGWDPTRSEVNAIDRPNTVRYGEHEIRRDGVNNPIGLIEPRIVQPDKVDVLATALCADADGATPCKGGTVAGQDTLPWAIRSANLTYVAEVPFSWVNENDRYLIYADLLYDALDPDRPEIRQAAVRLEDVSPVSDPDHIRTFTDYLHERGIPFQIAVIPRYLDPQGRENDGRPTSVTLEQAPQVVAALKYAQSRGGTLIQHGTTHQYRGLDNPYNGISGPDYEFIRSVCIESRTPPYRVVPCERDNFVLNTGPLEQDTVTSWKTRIEYGRQLFVEAGLEPPPLFETPHYAASNNAYRAASLVYPARYERVEYSDGLLRNAPSENYRLGMLFPYRITDPFGNTLVPENLGNYAPDTFSGHDPKPPEFLIDNARANLAVRESTASFFFHPYLPVEQFDKTIKGIEELGYTFVPATELR